MFLCLIDDFLYSCALVHMDPHPRLRKTSRWCNEQRVQNVMALNRKEETDLQQKLGQLEREQNRLSREFDYDIWKTRQAFNASKKVPPIAGDSKSRVRRNSLPSVEPTKGMMKTFNCLCAACQDGKGRWTR